MDRNRRSRSPEYALYKPGTVHSLANRLLKHVTGDPSIRFHHLRHTAISNQINSCWLSCTLIDVNPIEIVAASSGHANPGTTLRTYSHLYESSLRAWLTLAIQSNRTLLFQDWAYAATIKPNTFIQAVRRKNLTAAEHGWNLLMKAAADIRFESVEAKFQWGDVSCIAPQEPTKAPVFPATVAAALEHLQDNGSRPRAAAMLQISETELTTWLDHLSQWTSELLRLSFPRRAISNPKSLSLHLGGTHLFHKLDALGVSFRHARQEKYAQLAEYLQQTVPRDELSSAISSWHLCTKDQYISLSPPPNARGLLKLLKNAGVSSSAIRPVTSLHVNDASDPDIQMKSLAEQRALQSLFEQEFGLPPILQGSARRDGRPSSYMLWSSSPGEKKTSNAAGSLSGFKAWLISIQGYLLLKRINSHG